MLRREAAIVAGLASLLAGTGSALAARPVAGSVTGERLKIPSGPSSVRGLADEPTVDPLYAQVHYQVPIELPAGFGGLAPSLALTYSGALGNGPLGIGWSLGSARIERSTRLGVPRFDASDTLEITGIASGRLLAISATEYRVEGMGQNVRVVRVGSGFEVDDGNGLRYRLGLAASGRHESGAVPVRTAAWLVEEVTNQMGERIRYEYLRDQGQVYLSKVTWGPGDLYRVDLSYETRTDATKSYRSGFAVVTAKRLKSVMLHAFGTERRAYQLGYDATFPVARLAGVTSTGVGGNDAWPALSFTYAAAASPAVTPMAGVGTWRLNTLDTSLVDLDGDGAAELLQLGGGSHRYLANRDGAFTTAQPLSGVTQGISQLQLQDLDGDARAELVQETANGWVAWKFRATQWESMTASLPNGIWPGSTGVPLKAATVRFADLNGDGLADPIQWNSGGLLVRMATRTGLPATAAATGRIGGTVLPTAAGRFHDVNGDGLDDYVVVGANRMDQYVGRGDGTFDPMVPVSYPVAGVWEPANVELGDLDRDGLMDLVRIDLTTVRWFRGRPDGTFATAVTLPNPEARALDVVVAVADSNGNGSQDLVWSSPGGMWRLDLAGATHAGMLVRAQNGLGLDVTFDYKSSHALSVAARVAGSAWAFELPIALPVPVEKRTALGPGETTRKETYSVRDGVWDAAEQQFAGFLTTTVTTAGNTPAETSSVSTRYVNGTGNNRMLRGRPLNVQVKDGTGRRLSLTSNTWQTMVVAGLPDVPLLRRAVLREVRTLFEDTSPIRETRVLHDHDPLGRVRHTVDHGRIDLTGDEAVRDFTYADDGATWLRDRLCEEKVSSPTGEVLSHVQHLFGDAVVVQALCVVGKGWPRESRAWLAGENRFVTRSHTRYDTHGNPVSIVTGGVETRMAYDARGLFPIEERKVAAGRELVWQATWNEVLGVTGTLTDPNGHVSRASYDSLGRFTGVAVDGRHEHQILEYDWTAPFPKTTVWDFDGATSGLGIKPAAWSPTNRWRQSVEVVNGKGEVRYRAQRLAASTWIITGYQERDPSSRVVFAGRPVYAAQLELSARPTGIVGDELKYDPLGRLIEQQLPTGAKRLFSYTAFDRTMQEADLAPVHSVLDGQGRAILTERSLPDGTQEIVQASYDAAGRLTRMWLAGGTVQRDFTYDTLGQMIVSRDPDLGQRTLDWDDGGRLESERNAAGQSVRYTYDELGRLSTREAGGMYQFHYDDARPGAGAAAANLAGRLAWVEEPTGGTDTGYDDLGRTVFTRRRIDGKVSESTTSYAPSGLTLSRGYEDGFSMSYQYDPAGRLVGLGDLWQLLDQDAAGQPLHERAQNGVATVYERDGLGLASKVTVRDATGAAIYDARATRNAFTALTTIADLDGVGLDHSATFGYDKFARLTSASVGTGPAAFVFGYTYDVLHNMKTRTTAGPRVIGAFFGTHRYGEAGAAPRQLTSIANASGATVHTFAYDAAGRQTAQDDLVMTYDPSDRLQRVDGLPAGSVQHGYGHDGERVKTIAPSGAFSYFFGDGTAERNGVREHDVAVEDRIVARVAMMPGAAAASVSALATISVGGAPDRWRLVLAAFGLIAVGLLLRGSLRRGGRS